MPTSLQDSAGHQKCKPNGDVSIEKGGNKALRKVGNNLLEYKQHNAKDGDIEQKDLADDKPTFRSSDGIC
jgi:hypothetical protein